MPFQAWRRRGLSDRTQVLDAFDRGDAGIGKVRVVNERAFALDHSVMHAARRQAGGDVEVGQILDRMAVDANPFEPMRLGQPLVDPLIPLAAAEHVLERRHHPERQLEQGCQARGEAIPVVDAVGAVELGLSDWFLWKRGARIISEPANPFAAWARLASHAGSLRVC